MCFLTRNGGQSICLHEEGVRGGQERWRCWSSSDVAAAGWLTDLPAPPPHPSFAFPPQPLEVVPTQPSSPAKIWLLPFLSPLAGGAQLPNKLRRVQQIHGAAAGHQGGQQQSESQAVHGGTGS